MSELFRKQAVSAFYSTEARGTLLKIAPPSSVVLFGILTALLVGAGLELTLGHAEVYATGRGVVRPDQPPVVLRAKTNGVVATIDAAPGTRGKRGDRVAALDMAAAEAARATCDTEAARAKAEAEALDERLSQLEKSSGDRDATLALVLIAEARSARQKASSAAAACDRLQATLSSGRIDLPADAMVDHLDVAVGSQVREGDAIATVVPSTARLVAYIGVPEAHRSDLVVGKAVRLRFDALPSDSVGVGRGTITRILDALPSTLALDDGNAASAYAEVSIDAMPDSAQARPGMKLTADVFVRSTPVWTLLFGESRAAR